MNARARLARAILLATIVVAFGAASAEAQRSLSFNAGRSVNLSTRSLTFGFTEEILVICDVTLRGSLASLMPKVQGSRIGAITGVTVTGCRSSLGEATITLTASLNLPWEIQYRAFLGVLPNITGVLVNLVHSSWLFRFGGIARTECLYEGIVGRLIAIERGRTVNSRVLAGLALPLTRVLEQFFPLCPRSITFQGTFLIEPVQAVTLI